MDKIVNLFIVFNHFIVGIWTEKLWRWFQVSYFDYNIVYIFVGSLKSCPEFYETLRFCVNTVILSSPQAPLPLQCWFHGLHGLKFLKSTFKVSGWRIPWLWIVLLLGLPTPDFVVENWIFFHLGTVVGYYCLTFLLTVLPVVFQGGNSLWIFFWTSWCRIQVLL